MSDLVNLVIGLVVLAVIIKIMIPIKKAET